MHDYPLKQRTIGHLLADKAGRVGEKTWLIFGEQRYTYADAHDLSNRYANGFRELGVRKGDHVAVMLPNCPEFIWTIWGLGKLGAVTVPLNTAARGELLRYFITQSDSSCVVVAAEWADRVAEALGGDHRVRAFLTLGGAGTLANCGVTCVDLAAFAGAPAEEPDRNAVLASDPQYIMYTSGTTGPSKGVISPHSQAHGVGRSLAQNFGYRPDDVLFTCLPLFHGNALWYSCLCGAVGGLRAGGVAAVFGHELLGRDQGGRRHPVQLARRDDQHPAAGAAVAARPRASRAPGDDRPAVARILSRRFRALRHQGDLALCDDRNLRRDHVHAGGSRSQGRFRRQAARACRTADRQRRRRSAAGRRGRRDLRAAAASAAS